MTLVLTILFWIWPLCCTLRSPCLWHDEYLIFLFSFSSLKFTTILYLSRHNMLLKFVLAGCVSYPNLVNDCSWLVRASDWHAGGHGFDSLWGLRFFLCSPMLVTWILNLSLYTGLIVLFNQHMWHFHLNENVLLYLQHTPKVTPPPSPSQNAPVLIADVEQDEGPKAELDLCAGPKDAYVVEVFLTVVHF